MFFVALLTQCACTSTTQSKHWALVNRNVPWDNSDPKPPTQEKKFYRYYFYGEQFNAGWAKYGYRPSLYREDGSELGE